MIKLDRAGKDLYECLKILTSDKKLKLLENYL
jgi:hypothetical protein